MHWLHIYSPPFMIVAAWFLLNSGHPLIGAVMLAFAINGLISNARKYIFDLRT